MKRGFTLVELLVVISIVSMLASIVMVRVSLAQASARDGVRTQQVHQIDLATKLYVEKYGKAPLALTGCDVQSSAPTQSPSSCFAVSTGSVIQQAAWEQFKYDLSEFIKVPNDPCTGTCASGSNFPIGYTYVAPLAMQYYCATGGNCTATSESYQIYAPMERQTVPSGSNGSSANYATIAPPVLPNISSFTKGPSTPSSPFYTNDMRDVSFVVSDATSCVGTDERGNWNNTTISPLVLAPSRNAFIFHNVTVEDHVTLVCSNPAGSVTQNLCISKFPNHASCP